MAYSTILNVMVGAVRKASRAVQRDFGEVENLQVSLKGPGNFVTRSDKRTVGRPWAAPPAQPSAVGRLQSRWDVGQQGSVANQRLGLVGAALLHHDGVLLLQAIAGRGLDLPDLAGDLRFNACFGHDCFPPGRLG